MGRKELVLINLAPASSPCLLTGLLALVLPSRCAPSLQVELVLLASFSCCCLRVGGAGASGPACWRRGQRGNEQRESQAITQAKQDLVVYLPVMCAAFGVMRGPRRRPDELDDDEGGLQIARTVCGGECECGGGGSLALTTL